MRKGAAGFHCERHEEPLKRCRRGVAQTAMMPYVSPCAVSADRSPPLSLVLRREAGRRGGGVVGVPSVSSDSPCCPLAS